MWEGMVKSDRGGEGMVESDGGGREGRGVMKGGGGDGSDGRGWDGSDVGRTSSFMGELLSAVSLSKKQSHNKVSKAAYSQAFVSYLSTSQTTLDLH